MAEGIDLFMKGIIVSHDQGKSFQKVRIFDEEGAELSDTDCHMKVFSDRVNSQLFYGFGDDFSMYISKDRGNTFYPAKTEGIPGGKMNFGLIDCANKTEIRGEAGKEGIFYLAAGAFGLWKLSFDDKKFTVRGQRITGEGESAFRMGLGLLHQDVD